MDLDVSWDVDLDQAERRRRPCRRGELSPVLADTDPEATIVAPGRMSTCPNPTRRSSVTAPSSWPACARSPWPRSPRTSGSPTAACAAWMHQADVDGGHKAGLSTQERAELVELRRELRVAKMENEILKRAAAYFARENVLPK